MKVPQTLAFLFLVSLFFASCDDILFEHPQPPWISKNEKVFPEKLRGIYVSDKKDSIRIGISSIAPLHPGKNDMIFTLSDSLLLRVDQENYYLNMRADQYWDVTLGKINGDSLITYTLNGKDDAVRKGTGEITHLQEIKEDSGNYVINPSPEEFKKILDKNLFKRSSAYRRVRKGN